MDVLRIAFDEMLRLMRQCTRVNPPRERNDEEERNAEHQKWTMFQGIVPGRWQSPQILFFFNYISFMHILYTLEITGIPLRNKFFFFFSDAGTKWCGNGDIARDYRDLGADARLDACCREHDHCPLKVKALSRRYGFFNAALYTKWVEAGRAGTRGETCQTRLIDICPLLADPTAPATPLSWSVCAD